MDSSPAETSSLRLISREFDARMRPFTLEIVYLSFRARKQKMAEKMTLLASGKTGANDVVKTLVIDYTGLANPHGAEVEIRVEKQMLKNLDKIFSACPKLRRVASVLFLAYLYW